MENTTLKPYADYKPSGIEWLGDVPTHWDVRRIKSLSVVKRGASPRPIDDPRYFDENGEYAWVRISDVTASNHYLQKTTQRLSEIGQALSVKVEPGDMFLSIAGSVGKPIITSIKCCIHDGFVYFPYFKGSVEFLYRILSIEGPFAKLGKLGTQLNLNTDTVGNIYIGCPSTAEQASIVRYLDRTDDRIRCAISAKERLIELLTEQRQAVIHRAVTRGLDPNVQLKDSGAEWLGDLPAHWEVRRLGYLASKFGSGITPRGGATVYQETGIPFLRSQNIHFDGLRTANVAHISERMHNKLAASHVKPSDVLLNITGASIGRVCSVPTDFTEANVNQHVCIVRPRREHILSEFLSAYLSTPTIQSEIYIQQSGASREGLTLQSIRGFLIPVPPLAEQNAIAHYLDKATAGIDTAIANTQRQIDLLREYRTRLIADVVTGQVDVRMQSRE